MPFLFPGDVEGQPVIELKRFWARMRERPPSPMSASTTCAIPSPRCWFPGASLEMIGKLLGHTQIGTTQRYAHLIESPLRAGVNAVGEMLRPRLRVV